MKEQKIFNNNENNNDLKKNIENVGKADKIDKTITNK